MDTPLRSFILRGAAKQTWEYPSPEHDEEAAPDNDWETRKPSRVQAFKLESVLAQNNACSIPLKTYIYEGKGVALNQLGLSLRAQKATSGRGGCALGKSDKFMSKLDDN